MTGAAVVAVADVLVASSSWRLPEIWLADLAIEPFVASSLLAQHFETVILDLAVASLAIVAVVASFCFASSWLAPHSGNELVDQPYYSALVLPGQLV